MILMTNEIMIIIKNIELIELNGNYF